MSFEWGSLSSSFSRVFSYWLAQFTESNDSVYDKLSNWVHLYHLLLKFSSHLFNDPFPSVPLWEVSIPACRLLMNRKEIYFPWTIYATRADQKAKLESELEPGMKLPYSAVPVRTQKPCGRSSVSIYSTRYSILFLVKGVFYVTMAVSCLPFLYAFKAFLHCSFKVFILHVTRCMINYLIFRKERLPSCRTKQTFILSPCSYGVYTHFSSLGITAVSCSMLSHPYEIYLAEMLGERCESLKALIVV